MIKILLLLKNTQLQENILNILNKDTYEINNAEGELEDILTQIHHYCPDIILIDYYYKNC